MKMTTTDLAELTRAKTILENPGLAAKMTNLIGMPFEKALNAPPDSNQLSLF